MRIRGLLLVSLFCLLVACTSGDADDAAAPADGSSAAPAAPSEDVSEAVPQSTWSLEREVFAVDVAVNDVAALIAGGGGAPWLAVGSAAEAAGEPLRPVAWTGENAARWSGPAIIDADAGDAATAYDVARSGSTFVAVGQRWEGISTEAMLWTSADGKQWERREVPLETGSSLFGVVGTSDGFLASGSEPIGGESDAVLVESTDGEQWTPVEIEKPGNAAVAVSDLLDDGSVAVGYTRGEDAQPLVWHRRDGRFVSGKIPAASTSTSVETVVRYRGALHAFGIEGGATSRTVYWRSNNDGRTWQRKQAQGAYFDQSLTDLEGGLAIDDAVASRAGIFLTMSDGPASMGRTRNLRSWELLWPATPKGSFYVPHFDGIAIDGSDVLVAGHNLGGAFLWRYDAGAFRWFEVDEGGDAFSRDQAGTTLRTIARDGNGSLVAGGAAGASPSTDADVSLLWRGGEAAWEPEEVAGKPLDQWFNVLLETPDGLVGAGGRQPRRNDIPTVWEGQDGEWARVDDAAFRMPRGWSAYFTEGAVIGNGLVLGGNASDTAGAQRSVAWVRADGKEKWAELDLEQFLTRESRARLAEGDRRNPEVLATGTSAACSLNSRGILIGSIASKGAGASRPVVWSGQAEPGAFWRADRTAFPRGAEVQDCAQVGDRVIAVGDVDGYPAIWTSGDGRSWEGGRDAVGGDVQGEITVVVGNGDAATAVGGVSDEGVLKLRVWREEGGQWEALPDDPAFTAQDGLEVSDAVIDDAGRLTIVGALGTGGAVWQQEAP